MKKLLLLTAAIFLANGAFSQEKTIEEGLPYFNSIRATGKAEIVVTINPDKPLGMVVEYNGNDKSRLAWEVSKKGELAMKFYSNKKALPVRITLNCHTLLSLTLNGASLTVADKTVWKEKIATVSLSNGGRFTGRVDMTDLKLTASNGAAAVVTGKGRYATLRAHSKSIVDARELDVSSVSLTADGKAECYVAGRDRIFIEAFGAASIFYIGEPDILRVDAVKSAHIHHIGQN